MKKEKFQKIMETGGFRVNEKGEISIIGERVAKNIKSDKWESEQLAARKWKTF